MNINTFLEQLKAQLKKHCADFDVNEAEPAEIGSAINFLWKILTDLKNFIRAYDFKDDKEEIQFFKDGKPELLSQFLFYKKVFDLKLFALHRSAESRKQNYMQELEQLEIWLKKNWEFYTYYMSGMSHCDHQFFIRGKCQLNSVDRDERFSTLYDSQVARIMANDLLRKFILVNLQGFELSIPINSTSLTWTASKTDLIELIYGLHSAEVLNKGSIDLKQIASSFESIFQIHLGNYYRVFQDIRARKTGQTLFIDHIKQSLIHKISETDQ